MSKGDDARSNRRDYVERHESLSLRPLERSLGLLTWQRVMICVESPQVFVLKTPTEILARILYLIDNCARIEGVIVRTDLLAIHRKFFYDALHVPKVSFERLRPYLERG